MSHYPLHNTCSHVTSGPEQVSLDSGAILASCVLPGATMSANALLWRSDALHFVYQLLFLEQTHSTLNCKLG